MTPMVLEPGETRNEQRSLSLTKADKDRILQNFPEKISVSVPGFGNQDFPLRVFVKSFLDQVQPPKVRLVFSVEGDTDGFDGINIENSRVKVLGPSSGSFKAVDVEVAYAFDVDVEPGVAEVVGCDCDDGRDGQNYMRTFKFIWQIEISINPGISGLFEIEEFEISVATPCVCPEPEDEEEHDGEGAGEDDDDEGRKGKKRKKKSKRDED